MVKSLLVIAVGASLGAWMRWGLSLLFNTPRHVFPFGTLAANLIGGYCIGLAMAWLASRPDLSVQWRLFIITGLLGGLTTFSTYSAEVVQLMMRSDHKMAFAVMFSHVLGALSLTVLGFYSFRLFKAG